jgi:hypothetical protein
VYCTTRCILFHKNYYPNLELPMIYCNSYEDISNMIKQGWRVIEEESNSKLVKEIKVQENINSISTQECSSSVCDEYKTITEFITLPCNHSVSCRECLNQ